ncbi:hypothetical protein [Streptomyces sp. NPDC057460]
MADTIEELVCMRRATDEAHVRVMELREGLVVFHYAVLPPLT